MKSYLKEHYSLTLLQESIAKWWQNDPFTQSAAVAYYTIFSFPALLILYFMLASFFLDEAVLQQQVFGFMQESFGENSATLFKSVISKTAPSNKGAWPLVMAVGVLGFAALRLFLQLQKALNHIWETNGEALNGLKALVVRRLLSFAVMVSVLFTLCVSLLLTSFISVFTSWLVSHLPTVFVVLTHMVNLLVSFLLISVLFAIILKKLPDVKLQWKVVLPGATIAAGLFMLGEYILGIYFGTVKPASAYGVTGSVILLMMWVSYSCAILLLGAEYSKRVFDKQFS